MNSKIRGCIFIIVSLGLLFGCQDVETDSLDFHAFEHYKLEATEVDSYAFEAPSHFDVSLVKGAFKLVYKAEMVNPSVERYSVIGIKKERFSNDAYSKLMNYFSPGNIWFQNITLTKAEILQKIEDVKTDIFDDERQQKAIARLKVLLSKAPEHSDNELFSFAELTSGDIFYAYCKNGMYYSSFTGILDGGTLQYLRDDNLIIMCPSYFDAGDEKLNDFSTDRHISSIDAQKKAENALNDLGMDKMYSLYRLEKAIGYSGDRIVNEGWQFTFTRNCNGLQASFVDNYDIWRNSNAPCLAAPWEPECLFIYVDDKGIGKFDIRGIGNSSKTVYENVQLLDFDLMVNCITDQLVLQHAESIEATTDRSVYIRRLCLGSSLVNVWNVADYGIMIPTWEVTYDLFFRYPGCDIECYNYTAFLNAIDGKYIEPRISIDELSQLYQ